MSKVSDWLIEIEEEIGVALEKGLTDPYEIYTFVNKTVHCSPKQIVGIVLLGFFG